MTTTVIGRTVLGLTACAAAPAPTLRVALAGPIRHDAEIAWRADYASAAKEAAKAGKPVLVVVGSERCAWCAKQDKTTWRSPLVASLTDRVVPVKVDGNRDRNLVRKFGVRGYPTTLLVDPDGTILARHEGYATPPEMCDLIRRAPARK